MAKPTALILLASFFWAGIAQQQQKNESDSEQPDVVYEEIVVKGEKMNRSQQDTATSVAVITSDELEKSSYQDLKQLINRTANIGGTSGGEGFNIRGIDQRGFSSTTNQTFSIFVDGGTLNVQESSFGPISTWDLEQVELFRGPQSTTQGRNSLAGAIVLRSRAPSHTWDFRARVHGGEEGHQQFAAAVGGPIVKGVLAFRVSAEGSSHRFR